MCGMAGAYSSYLSDDEIYTFRELMVLASLRGRFGSGIVNVPKNKKKAVIAVKRDWNGGNFVWTKDFNDAVKGNNVPKILMGHCRYPTSGDMETDSLHPHIFGNIYGMHNGTMEHVLGEKPKESSDSSMLFRAFKEHGHEHTIKNSKGAMALTWINHENETLNFYRNSRRPLCIGRMENRPGTIFWASETDALLYVLRRQNCGKVTFTPLPENKVVTYKYTNSSTIPVSQTEIKPEKTSVPSVRENLSDLFNDADQSIDPDMYSVLNKQIPYHELMRTLQKGCCWCSSPALLSEHVAKKLHWTDTKAFSCAECFDSDPIVREHYFDSVGKHIH